MEFKFNFLAMVDAIPETLIGWGGVFVVTAIIIASIWVLNKVTEKKSK